MSRQQFLEAGAIAGTHGVRGMLRLKPWSDTPEFLLQFSTLYLDGKAFGVHRMSVHKSMLLVELDGIDTLEKAIALRGSVVTIDREEAELPEGRHFIADLIGLRVLDEEGRELGKITDVLNLPSNDVYVVKGAREYMIPAVNEYIIELNIDDGWAKIRLIEGMATDEN